MSIYSTRLPWVLFVINSPTAAPVNSDPLWQNVQPPLVRKTSLKPRSASVDRAVTFPSMYLSNGLSLDTSVASYNWIEIPQKSEKFFSIWVYPFQVAVEDQYFGWNAFITIWLY